jgi:hypothetical protein
MTWPRRRRFNAVSNRDEVLRFLLHLDVTVAQDAEGTVAAGQEPRKQAGQEHADHRLDADEADRRHPVAAHGLVQRQADEAHQLHGDRQQRVHGGAVALAPQLHAHRDAGVLDEGERVRGVDRKGVRMAGTGSELPVEPFALGGSFGSTMWMPAEAISARSVAQQACWSPERPAAKWLISTSCCSGVNPSWLVCTMPAATWPYSPATRTM